MGQRDQVAARREAENLVPEHLELGVLQKLIRSLRLLHDVEQLAQPAVLRRIGLAPAVRGLLFVRPVGRQPVLGEVVHLTGADLDLDPVAVGPDHGRVDRAVAVGLRQADIILETAGADPPGAVNCAERPIAFLDRPDLDTKSHDVAELFELDILALHLAPDRIGRFFPAAYVRLQAGVLKRPGKRIDDPRHQRLAGCPKELEPLHDRRPRIRVDMREGQILQLVLQFAHADTLGKRAVNFERFAGDALALFPVPDVIERAHVVQPVGQLDQQDPQILRHGEQQLAEILRLPGFRTGNFELGQLGDAVDQLGDLRAEQVFDFRQGRAGIFDGIVEQRRDDRGAVQTIVGEDARDLDRMGEIGIAAGALLRTVRLHREHVSPVYRLLVGRRIVLLDGLDKFVLPHHRETLCDSTGPNKFRPEAPGLPRDRQGPFRQARRRIRRGTRVRPSVSPPVLPVPPV